ncbi:hypothetical protein AMECASPLE_013372 [Ameca splendens]|uniref:Uncharacterized protein n=1 Tax=Ameca splendens TaxID=208324 RepID=A0ABV1A8P9_9TELE
MQWKNTETHIYTTRTHAVLLEEWTDRQTDCCHADKLLAPGGKMPWSSESVFFIMYFVDVPVETRGTHEGTTN